MLGLLEKMFPQRIEAWRPSLTQMVPSWGRSLSDHPDEAHRLLDHTAEALGLTHS